MRALHTPHRAYGVAVDEEAQELYLTIEHPPEIDVYRKTANGEDKPLRTLKGDNTRLADAHGIAIDPKNGWMFVSNHGSASSPTRKGGRFDPPSITVYPLKATGDTAPIRTIAGPKTQLNWPEPEGVFVGVWSINDRGVQRAHRDNAESQQKHVFGGAAHRK